MGGYNLHNVKDDSEEEDLVNLNKSNSKLSNLIEYIIYICNSVYLFGRLNTQKIWIRSASLICC